MNIMVKDSDKIKSEPNSDGDGLLQSPPGLEALFRVCRKIYPDQRNPLLMTALIKYWLGGPDPLDYISMYSNPGDPALGVPPHWHYISFGLSDLHGDGRVHQVAESSDAPSGYGFELTFRLKREPCDSGPPTWPATLLQALAKYVFHSGNVLCPGDHVSWHSTLDGSDSCIEHMLLTADSQLPVTSTPSGVVTFVQVVGVCKEELDAAQKWNGQGVLEILKTIPNGRGGGVRLVTDMRRGESMLQLDTGAAQVVENGIEKDGSNLSGVTAFCFWSESLPGAYGGNDESDLAAETEGVYKSYLLNEQNCGPIYSKQFSHCKNHEEMSHFSLEERPEPTELVQPKKLNSLHLTFNLEAGNLLPLALRGRVKHGRHFTFKSALGDKAITFVAESVTGKFVDSDKPYVAHGPWLQVLIPQDFLSQILANLSVLSSSPQVQLPKSFYWCERNLAITIIPDSLRTDSSQFVI